MLSEIQLEGDGWILGPLGSGYGGCLGSARKKEMSVDENSKEICVVDEVRAYHGGFLLYGLGASGEYISHSAWDRRPSPLVGRG